MIRRFVVCAVAVLGVVAACTQTDEAPSTFDQEVPVSEPRRTVASGPPADRTPPTSVEGVTTPPSPSPSVRPADYGWRQLPIGAGGWVTGIVVHPTTQGVRFIRTDVGGAYRFDGIGRQWVQMIDALSVPLLPGGSRVASDYSVESLAVSPSDPEVVYAAVGNQDNPDSSGAFEPQGRIMRSDDAGRTWVYGRQRFFVGGNQRFRQLAERLAVDPGDARHVYFGTRREGLQESFDGGITWSRVAEVPLGQSGDISSDQAGVSFVSCDPTGTTCAVGVAGQGVFARRSDDGAFVNISQVASADTVPTEGTFAAGRLLVAFNSVDNQTESSVQVYSLERGTWVDITPERRHALWAGAIDPFDPNVIVMADGAVRDGGLWISNDGGVSWETKQISIAAPDTPWLAATDLADYMSIGRLVFDPLVEGRLWFAEGMGLWRTGDLDRDDVIWTLDSEGIDELVTADIITPPGGAPVSAVADRQGFLHENLAVAPERPLIDDTFAGGTDLDYAGQLPNELVWIGAEYHIYGSDSQRARGAVSHDGGRSWDQLGGLPIELFGGNVAISAGDPQNIVWLPSYFRGPYEHLDSPKGVYATTNAGASWTHLPEVGGSSAFHRLLWWFSRQALASDKVESGVFYLQGEGSQFLVSSDGGLSWTAAPFAVPCGEWNACHVYGQLVASPVEAGTLLAGAGSDGLWRTTDRGETEWQRFDAVDEVRSVSFGAPLNPGGPLAIYLFGKANGDNQLGIYRSSDGGTTWESIGREPAGLYTEVGNIRGDMNTPGRVYVGTSGTGFVFGDDAALG